MKRIDEVSMVAWCRCPAGARALDHELAQRRPSVRSDAAPPAVPARRDLPAPRALAVTRSEPSREPPVVLRPVQDTRGARESRATPIHVVDGTVHDAVATRAAPFADVHLVAVGYRADDRAGVAHYLTLRIRGEQVELPCDRETADEFAASLSAGKSLRYRLSLDPVRD